ncbi:MAG: hypothetical protein ACH349_01095 [Candidatus Rhabdochlamydia sp.]|jgi:hypothetical protein|nr:hypothetical protein [Chlamydiota bacterium]
MTIHPLVSLPLSSYKQPQNTSDALVMRKKRKMLRSQKYNEEPIEKSLHQNLGVKLQRRGIKRLQNKELKV